ncbi:yeeS domain protein [Escherichia coli 5-172-05_S4_C3]|nr:yeeS domain protein [Escherichia coli 5-172-05_S4_C2]KEL39021.1 yeeS domain protein [Escherichia coli 5-172-05_S4_C1]KEL57891.1 yeeS domain protein [Escherichia coli 5-172-05_S4_C3]
MQQLSFLPGNMTPGERSLILRALQTLDRHLHEPGVAFTSTRAAREWLILNMAGLEREEFRVLYLNNHLITPKLSPLALPVTENLR